MGTEEMREGRENMISLAFDTSNQTMAVALLDDDVLLAEFRLTIKRNHSISLMPTIDFMMAQVGLTPSDLDRVVVAKGPGSYTGLRVAVATAKTLAYSLGIDLVGVSSLQILAASMDFEGLIVPLIDARRQHVYAGFYQDNCPIRPDRHMSLNELLVELAGQERLAFVGETGAFAEEIRAAFPNAVIETTLPSAAVLGRLGQYLPPEVHHAFVPDYLKRVEAEENWLKGKEHDGSRGDYVKRV